jgi:hypothetical protein
MDRGTLAIIQYQREAPQHNAQYGHAEALMIV